MRTHSAARQDVAKRPGVMDDGLRADLLPRLDKVNGQVYGIAGYGDPLVDDEVMRVVSPDR